MCRPFEKVGLNQLYYISTEIIEEPSLDTPLSRVKCAGTLQSSGSSSSVACLILGHQGSALDDARKADNQTRSECQASLQTSLFLSLFPVSYFSHRFLSPLFLFRDSRRVASVVLLPPRFYVTGRSSQLTRSWITMINALSKKVMLIYIVGCVHCSAHGWQHISSDSLRSCRNYSSHTLVDKTACWIIIGHRSLSSGSRVSSYIKPQTRA